MKSPEFFIERAEELIQEIDELISTFQSSSKGTIDGDFEIDKKQVELATPFYIRVKLLLGEFDNSKPLMQEIDRIHKSHYYMFNESRRLEDVKNVIQMFIEHIKVFRLDEVKAG